MTEPVAPTPPAVLPDVPDLPEEVDVVVVGSGAAGLSAALTAATAGVRVLVLEAGLRWAGTTGLSGGAVWVPVNHAMAAAGISDSLADAWQYCRPHAPGRDPSVVETYLRAGPAAVRAIEEHTPLEFRVMDFPDTFAEAPGGRLRGRHLEISPLDIGDVSPDEEFVWTAPFPMVLTNDELFGGTVHGGTTVPLTLIGRRIAADEVTLGLGLSLGLLEGCRRAGVGLVADCRVRALGTDADGRVDRVLAHRGGAADADGTAVTVRARRGVVLATGGYEADPALSASLVGGPLGPVLAPPVGTGDAVRLAASVGAALAHVGEAWCSPSAHVEGREWPDGTPRPLLLLAERCMPHSLWVDGSGRRFVNEASHNCTLAFAATDPATHRPRHENAWAVCDVQYREAYAFAGLAPGARIPSHVVLADTVAELAAAIGVDADVLQETLDRFNEHARAGVDPDFGRGASAYDRYNGDARAPHPNLGTVEKPPFFATRISRSPIATKGGPRVDSHGRVLGWDGAPLAGLFAAGGAAPAIFGPGAIAYGMHLGAALTTGWLAANAAVGVDPSRAPGWLCDEVGPS